MSSSKSCKNGKFSVKWKAHVPYAFACVVCGYTHAKLRIYTKTKKKTQNPIVLSEMEYFNAFASIALNYGFANF